MALYLGIWACKNITLIFLFFMLPYTIVGVNLLFYVNCLLGLAVSYQFLILLERICSSSNNLKGHKYCGGILLFN